MSELVLFMQQLAIMYLTGAAGYLAKKAGLLNKEADSAIAQIVLYIALPALILYSMDFPFTFSLLKDMGWLVLMSFISLSFSCIIAYVLASRSNIGDDRKGVYQGVIIFGNQGFLGYAVSYSLFLKEGGMYAAIFNILYLFLIWSYGIHVVARNRQSISWKAIMLNPGIIFTALGFAVFLLPFGWPPVLSQFFQNLGSPTTPLSMLFIGSLSAELDKKTFLNLYKDPYLWIACFTKLLIIPLPLFIFINFDIKFSVLVTAVLVSSMPCAPTIPIYTKKYGGDTVFGSVCVFVSTILLLLTLPLLYSLLNLLAG